MGCEQSQVSSYNLSIYQEETDIRNWELGTLEAFSKNFTYLLASFNLKLLFDSSKILYENLKNFLDCELKKGIYEKFLENDYFIKSKDNKQKYYDPDKIKCLFFLLTNSNISEGQVKNQDKSRHMLFTLVEEPNKNVDDDDDDDYEDAPEEIILEKGNKSLLMFLNVLVYISCFVMVGKN